MFSDCFIGQIVLSIPLDLSLRDGSASSPRLLSSPARPQCESVSLFAGVRRQQHKAFSSHGSDHRPSASSSAPPALERSVLASPLSCRDGSEEIKQDFKELVHDDCNDLRLINVVGFSCRWRSC